MDGFVELTEAPVVQKWLSRPRAKGSLSWMPEIEKVVTWLAMQHVLQSDKRQVYQSNVRIRLKPTVGVFASSPLKSGSRFPVISQAVMPCEQSNLQQAAFQCKEKLFVFPARPKEAGGDREKEDPVWNPASAIRLVSSDSSRKELEQVNAAMALLRIPVVTACCGVADEFMGVLPAVELTKDVEADVEIVCLIDPDIYIKPEKKNNKRSLAPKAKASARVKRTRSDPMTL